MDQLKQLVEGTIDFEGQRLVDKLNYLIITIGGIVSFLIGFLFQQIDYSLYSLAVTLVITEIVVVPPWKFYNQNTLTWQAPGN